MFYDHKKIESDWQNYWHKHQTFKTSDAKKTNLPKYYVLDMFPYPSGAGLHVGHPLGYIASDIYARYKRHQGFNVLHPIGYDSFGLPAEQYAIQTGQHPAITTQENITRYEEQLRRIGFSFDWSREVRTSNSDFYKWTQWIFIEFFHSWYNKTTDKAEKIETLIAHLEKSGTENLNASETENLKITAEDWNNATEKEKQNILLNYRLAYRAETTVNWCPGLGTVLANDEVKDGKSERGGFPVFQKKMMQWSMRISAYSERLLEGLETIDWPQPLKDSQKYWIGKSVGALVEFPLSPKGGDISNTKLEAVDESIKNKSGKFDYMTGGNNSALLIVKAQEHLENPTEAEAILWEHLISKKLGHKFRQQHLVENFIVDFVCLKKGLIIEVDGGYHNNPEQQTLDEERTKTLNEKGFEVVRFKNEEVIADIENVLNKIKEKLLSKPDIIAHKTESQPLFHPLWERGISVFTTRPDTIFAATFMVLAPENPMIESLTTDEQKSEVDQYIEETSKKTERDRMTDVKTVSGAFTGSFAINPFTEKEIPIYISDYVLMGYGTGAVMAVPAHDERDHRFAKKFGIEILQVVDAEVDIQEESFDSKDSVCINSGFLNGLKYEEAKEKIISEIENRGIGKGNINYRQRDAIFSRQRYWGEPVPVYYKDEVPYTLPLSALPLELPEVEKYLPTAEGNPPLGNAKEFAWDEENQQIAATNLVNNETVFPLELSTMPGWAGSSWYFLRYMDPHNETGFVSKEKTDYWGQVDLYIGGSEHATGHLLYARFWNKFLKDRGFIKQDEPFKKLINQGMILGMSAYVYRYKLVVTDLFILNQYNLLINDNQKERVENYVNKFNDEFGNLFLSKKIKNDLNSLIDFETAKIVEKFREILGFEIDKDLFDFLSVSSSRIPVDVSLLKGTTDELDIEKFKNWRSEYADAEFIFESGTNSLSFGEGGGEEKYICEREVEKMSKSKYNVVNPDEICEEYGADCLRLYEMFLGPLEQSKPWNTQGLSGVYGFLKKFYNLYFKEDAVSISEEEPGKEEWKVLHTLIKKFETDIQNFSFNTSVSSFMIAVNDLQKLKCSKRAILEPLAIVISPYAPHICEELWSILGHQTSVEFEKFPVLEEKYLVEDQIEYPISINGKMKFKLLLSAELSREEVEKSALEDERVKNLLGGSTPKKIIVVPKKIVNIVM